MLCIIAFIIFLIFFPILGFFSEYRKLFAKSWSCVFNRITLKPCDVNLGEELKTKFLSKVYLKSPKLGKFLDTHFGTLAIIFVIINIWSIVSVLNSSMNLYVYGICDASTGESCSLSGEACGVSSSVTFDQALNGKMGEYLTQPFTTWATTVSKIPDRAKNWKAEDYLTQNPSYKGAYQQGNPYAVEFIDPGCQFCRQLYLNIKETDFSSRYNLSYVLYPIPDNTKTGEENGGYKFRASEKLSQYLEAIKIYEAKKVQIDPKADNSPLKAGNSKDWQFLDILFGFDEKSQTTTQNKFNSILNKSEIEPEIQKIMTQIGYTEDEIKTVAEISTSQEVKDILVKNADIVRNQVKTIRIPTIIFGGQRYDKVVKDELRK